MTGLVTRVQTDRCVYRSGPSKTWLKSKTRRAQPSGASARRTGDKEPPSRHLGYPVGPLRTAVRWPGTVLLTLPPHPRDRAFHPPGRAMSVRLIKHEAVPHCGSFEVRFSDGRPSTRGLQPTSNILRPDCRFEGTWHDWERDEWMTLGCLKVKDEHREGSYGSATGPRAISQVSMQGTYWIDGEGFIHIAGQESEGKSHHFSAPISVENERASIFPEILHAIK